MIELFPEGFEEVDTAGGLELAAYTNAGGEERVWQVFGPGRAEDIEPGWTDAWKRFHRPVKIGPLWIGPPWEESPDGALRVVVDPGQAFGTGAHPTTQLCLAFLLREPRGSVLDLGCGSGVLAIAAAKLGFRPVIAVDLDPTAVRAAKANAAANGVDFDVRLLDALAGRFPEAGLALANIALRQAEEVALRVPARRLVTSGYLVSEEPGLEGWARLERRSLEGWAADLSERL
jgi:ribosomal protein L11 methyltransferase